MTFWLIVIVVNVVLHGAALAMVRRPIARDLELTPGDLDAFSAEHRALVESIDQQAAQRGFRWFGAATTKTWLDKPPQPAAIWWNGDLGAWLTFESIGRKWNLELGADLADGSMLGVSKVPIVHLSPPPGAVLISDSRVRSFDALISLLPVDLRSLPTRRGWPAPGQHWAKTVERRRLMLAHWTSTGRAATTTDGRGVRVSFWAANLFVLLAGFGVRQIYVAWNNRRSRTQLAPIVPAALPPLPAPATRDLVGPPRS